MESIADFIFLLHSIFVLFVLLAPFSSNEAILLLHTITIPFILLHWVTNDNTCCLTVTEQFFRKDVPKSELFFQKLIGPVYEPRYDIAIISIMLVLLGISLMKIYEKKDRVLHIIKLFKEDMFGKEDEEPVSKDE